MGNAMDACNAGDRGAVAAPKSVLSGCAKCKGEGSDDEGGPRSKGPQSRDRKDLKGCKKPLLREAKVSPVFDGGMTTLMVAAQTGSLENVKRLVGEGADVNARDPVIGWSALHWAAKERHAGICAELLRSGADIALANTDGKTPVQVAAEQDASFAKKLEVMGMEHQMAAAAAIGDIFA